MSQRCFALILLISLLLVAFSQETIPWKACPNHVKIANYTWMCAHVSVPYIWGQNNQNLTYFVRRLRKDGLGRHPDQVWLISGGPGGSGEFLSTFASRIAVALRDGMDIFIPDHRGTGHSTRFNCSQENNSNFDSEKPPGRLWTECIRELQANKELFSAITPTQAAHDIHHVMKVMKQRDNQRIYLYGLSYGSFLVHRFLQIYAYYVDRVIMDGVAAPQMIEFLKYDQDSNQVGLKFLLECHKNAFCASRTGNITLSTQMVFHLISQGKGCINVTREWLRNRLFVLLRAREFDSRVLIAPFIHRFLRCSPSDKIALEFFKQKIPVHEMYRDYTQLTYANIGVSEMLFNSSDLPTIQEMQKKQEGYWFSADLSLFTRHLKTMWPAYPVDQYHNRFAQTNVPFLMIHGDLDPQTPIEHADFLFKKMARTEFQRLIKFKNLPHRIIARENCGFGTIVDFINGKWNVNPSCRDEYQIDFEGKTQNSIDLAQKYFDSSSLW